MIFVHSRFCYVKDGINQNQRTTVIKCKTNFGFFIRVDRTELYSIICNWNWKSIARLRSTANLFKKSARKPLESCEKRPKTEVRNPPGRYLTVLKSDWDVGAVDRSWWRWRLVHSLVQSLIPVHQTGMSGPNLKRYVQNRWSHMEIWWSSMRITWICSSSRLNVVRSIHPGKDTFSTSSSCDLSFVI
mgnify:CR=1 FL=1